MVVYINIVLKKGEKMEKILLFGLLQLIEQNKFESEVEILKYLKENELIKYLNQKYNKEIRNDIDINENQIYQEFEGFINDNEYERKFGNYKNGLTILASIIINHL